MGFYMMTLNDATWEAVVRYDVQCGVLPSCTVEFNVTVDEVKLPIYVYYEIR
jgi:hypothetical protein